MITTQMLLYAEATRSRHIARSHKQRAVIAHLAAHDTLTLEQAVGMIGGDIYANASKHVGALLANMVRRGLIIRRKPGVFAAPSSDLRTPNP